MLSGLLGLAAMSFFELALFSTWGSHCEYRDTALDFLDVEILRSGRTPLRLHPPPWPLLSITYVTYNRCHSNSSAEARGGLIRAPPHSSQYGSSRSGPTHQCGGVRSYKVPEP